MSYRPNNASAWIQPAAPAHRTSAEYRALDAAHHLHPFSDMGSLNRAGSRVIVKAEGVHLWDSDGNRIIDGMAGLWCVNVGYGRDELIEAGSRQLRELPFYNTFFKTTHPPVIELSALLAQIAPPAFNRFFYCNSGSEGNDTVLRIAHQYWRAQNRPQKKFVISRRNGYHGSTIAGATLGGMRYMHEQMPSKVEHIVHIDQPYYFGEAREGQTPEAFGLERARQLEAKILELGAQNVAAFIGEPFQGAGGVIFPPSTYWPEIERICRQYDVLLVADEVIGGFGRTGEWFAHQHFGFAPDLTDARQGPDERLRADGRGRAVGPDRRRADRARRVQPRDDVLRASGRGGGGRRESEGAARRADRRAREDRYRPYFQQRLRETFANHPIVGDIAGAGLVAGIQLAREPRTRKRFENGGEVGTICRDYCFNGNLIMRATGDRMLLSPPLVISKPQIDEIVEKAKRAIDATAQQLGLS
ncbi:aminotransferase class-III family protein [Burkholderia pseudomallei MSHR640]|nr:aminotransferase class-III family protein [Burkholderia pseudomallei MSHR640]